MQHEHDFLALMDGCLLSGDLVGLANRMCNIPEEVWPVRTISDLSCCMGQRSPCRALLYWAGMTLLGRDNVGILVAMTYHSRDSSEIQNCCDYEAYGVEQCMAAGGLSPIDANTAVLQVCMANEVCFSPPAPECDFSKIRSPEWRHHVREMSSVVAHSSKEREKDLLDEHVEMFARCDPFVWKYAAMHMAATFGILDACVDGVRHLVSDSVSRDQCADAVMNDLVCVPGRYAPYLAFASGGRKLISGDKYSIGGGSDFVNVSMNGLSLDAEFPKHGAAYDGWKAFRTVVLVTSILMEAMESMVDGAFCNYDDVCAAISRRPDVIYARAARFAMLACPHVCACLVVPNHQTKECAEPVFAHRLETCIKRFVFATRVRMSSIFGTLSTEHVGVYCSLDREAFRTCVVGYVASFLSANGVVESAVRAGDTRRCEALVVYAEDGSDERHRIDPHLTRARLVKLVTRDRMDERLSSYLGGPEYVDYRRIPWIFEFFIGNGTVPRYANVEWIKKEYAINEPVVALQRCHPIDFSVCK